MADGVRLMPEDLPERVRSSGQTQSLLARGRERRWTVYELEREYIVETLRLTGGNKSRAAEILGLDRRTLHRKLDEYRAADPAFSL
jgi:DNA-binding NtrC family response regulator